MSRKKKSPGKSMPIGLKLFLILLLSCSMVGTAVFAAFAFENIHSLLIAIPSGIVAFITLLILLKDYKIENGKTTQKKQKTTRWYIDKIIAGFVPVWVITAIVLIAVGSGENEVIMYAGFLMFPVISILIAPNAALYAIKDSKNWKSIFYGKGNLEKFKDNKDFYWMKAPVAFEKRVFWTVVKDRILNIFTLVSFMVIAAAFGLLSILTYDSHSVSPGNLFGAIFYVRVRRGTGVMAFILLLIVVFGFPAFVYFITDAIYKLRIVTKHEYLVYHAIVSSVNTYKLRIDNGGRKYEYKYGTLVGMKEKQINNTPAVMIFIPDDVLIFPDEVIT